MFEHRFFHGLILVCSSRCFKSFFSFILAFDFYTFLNSFYLQLCLMLFLFFIIRLFFKIVFLKQFSTSFYFMCFFLFEIFSSLLCVFKGFRVCNFLYCVIVFLHFLPWFIGISLSLLF